MKAVKKVLALEVTKAMTAQHIVAYYDKHAASVNAALLEDVRASVDGIPAGALPMQTSYKLFADTMSTKLCKVLSDHDVSTKTISNVRAMVKLASVEVLQLRVEVVAAQAKAAKATTKAAKAATAKAVIKAKAANSDRASSLEKASKAGRRVVDRKTTTISGFATQTAKNKAKAKREPTKSELKAAKDSRTADKELILQALDHAKSTSLDDDASADDIGEALRAVAFMADKIVSYLPADMRTL